MAKIQWAHKHTYTHIRNDIIISFSIHLIFFSLASSSCHVWLLFPPICLSLSHHQFVCVSVPCIKWLLVTRIHTIQIRFLFSHLPCIHFSSPLSIFIILPFNSAIRYRPPLFSAEREKTLLCCHSIWRNPVYVSKANSIFLSLSLSLNQWQEKRAKCIGRGRKNTRAVCTALNRRGAEFFLRTRTTHTVLGWLPFTESHHLIASKKMSWMICTTRKHRGIDNIGPIYVRHPYAVHRWKIYRRASKVPMRHNKTGW